MHTYYTYKEFIYADRTTKVLQWSMKNSARWDALSAMPDFHISLSYIGFRVPWEDDNEEEVKRRVPKLRLTDTNYHIFTT